MNEKTINPYVDSKTIKAKDANTKTGWEEEDKLISETEGASMIIESISFSQFWITGNIDPNYGEIEIYIDEQRLNIVSLYNEKHEENIVIYESPRYNSISNHKITIKNIF